MRANQVPPQATRARENTPVAAREREPAPAAEVDAGAKRPSGRGEDFTKIRLRGDPPVTPSTPPPFDQLPPRLQEGLLARAASSLSGGSGQALPPELRDAIDATVGRPPDPSVRVRQGPASELAATRLGARAFTIGRDIHLGPTASPADDRLLLHEAVHTMQQGGSPRARSISRVEGAHERNAASVVDAIERGAAASVLSDAPAVVHRDVIDDVRNKLSYKLLDWAVTDADAEQSLALLNSIPDATLAVQIARLEDKYVTRLLDNLPDRDKTGPQYTRIIQALGPRTAGFVENRLSRGLFDWAVTDEDAGDVFNVFANYTPVQQDQFMESLLDRKRLATLVANATGSQEALYLRPWMEHLRPISAALNLSFKQDEILRVITMETDTAETARVALGVRFNLDVGPITATHQVSTGKPEDQRLPTSFTLAQLRDAFKVLEQLPPGHVERNNALDRLTRFRSTQSSGEPGAWYFSSTNEAAIGGSGDDAFFESSLRHEVGHGVDQKLGRAATAAPADKAAWVQWMDALSAALDAVNHSPTKAINGLGALDQIPIVDEMVTTMGSQDTDNVKVVAALRARIAALGIWAAMPAAGRDALKQRVLLDPALRIIVNNRDVNRPWSLDPGDIGDGRRFDDYVLVQSQGTWFTYSYAARKRQVSNYQFRAPKEWFAEAYVWYYEPDPRGRGMKLNDKDPATKVWFDNNVQTIV